jgi:uncharacterized phage protein gp47/JayE
MAEYSVPTHEDLIDEVGTHFEDAISGSTPRLRATDEYAFSHAQAGLVKGLYGHQQEIAKQIFGSTANEANFWRHAADDGIYRKAATYSEQTYRFVGVNGTVIPADTEVERADGLTYFTQAEVTIASGIADVTIQASEPGEAYNNANNQQLTLTAPITGATDVGTVQATLSEGTDAETHAEGLERWLQHIRNPPSGGGPGDYVRWTRLYPGVTRAWEFPLLEGSNSVSVAFVSDDDDGTVNLPDLTLRNAVATFLKNGDTTISDEFVGIPITVTLYIITLVSQTINLVFSELTPNTADVRDAIAESVADLLYREGGPGKTIPLSRLDAAISSAAGEISHVLTTPAADIVSTTLQVPIIGTVTVTP